MTLETFFKKFDQFADAPGAVTKVRRRAAWVAPSGLGLFFDRLPRALPFGLGALPWATLDRAVGAHEFRPKGANYASPGHRPGIPSPQSSQALKGRPIR